MRARKRKIFRSMEGGGSIGGNLTVVVGKWVVGEGKRRTGNFRKRSQGAKDIRKRDS